jgi:hypothetical protein
MDFNAETWVAIASAITAVCALGATIWQGQQNYKHNKLSVRPKLTAMENYENTEEARKVTFELINAGFGPAIFKDFILVYDGKEISKNNRKTYEDFLTEKTRGFTDVGIFSFIPDSTISAGECCELFSFTYKHEQDASFIHKLNIRINYQSIYEDEIIEYDSRKDRQYFVRDEQTSSSNEGGKL